MKRSLLIAAYGVGGLLVAIGLTFGAFALAGKDISTPAGQIKIQKGAEVVPAPEGTKPSPKPDRSPEGSTGPREQPSEAADDHGGEASETPTPTHTESGDGGSGESDGSGSDDSGSSDSGSRGEGDD